MMKALTETERADLLAKIDGLNQRVVDLEREERGHRASIHSLDEDVANGKAGAKAEAIKLDEKARAARLEIEACERASEAAQRRYKEDEPFRDAERAAERKKLCLAAIEVSLGKARAVDEAARSFVKAVLDHQESLNKPIEYGVDPAATMRLAPQWWFDHALVAAGASRFRPDLQRSPNGPNTVEEYTRENLRF